MEDHVALVYEFGDDRLVVHGVNRVVVARVALQVRDVVYGAGREVVNAEDLVAALDVCVGEVRADEARPARDENSQKFFSPSFKLSAARSPSAPRGVRVPRLACVRGRAARACRVQ